MFEYVVKQTSVGAVLVSIAVQPSLIPTPSGTDIAAWHEELAKLIRDYTQDSIQQREQDYP